MSDCLFCRIVDREIPATVVAESPEAMAFRDIEPQAPTHVLVIPKAHYATAAELAAADATLAGNLVAMAAQVAEAEGIADDGYRLLFNTGADSGQLVFHVHLHLLGGRPLGPMLAG